ncbi:MAG: GNAT family N-acetyltransferase [Gammaproteobacteria bacterium]|nr:GNAT family N-acetyltransferase [Gammaproteobacteria bacterium]
MGEYQLIKTTFQQDRELISFIREQVFIIEQHVPVELEWDEHDHQAVHLLAMDNNRQAIGTVRLLADGHIGRMAVLSSWRKRGVGSHLLAKITQIAQQSNMQRVFLNAQTSAVSFYSQYGFLAHTEIFMDAGIPHQYMYKSLSDQ